MPLLASFQLRPPQVSLYLLTTSRYARSVHAQLHHLDNAVHQNLVAAARVDKQSQPISIKSVTTFCYFHPTLCMQCHLKCPALHNGVADDSTPNN